MFYGDDCLMESFQPGNDDELGFDRGVEKYK